MRTTGLEEKRFGEKTQDDLEGLSLTQTQELNLWEIDDRAM